MTFVKTSSKIASVLGAAALALTLSACSGGQSVAEACTIAEETVAEANTQMQELSEEALQGDGNLADLFTPLNTALAAAQKKVTNTEVSAALKSVSTEFSKMGDILGDFKMPNMDEIDMTDPKAMDDLKAMQEDAMAISEKLEESSKALTESGKELQALCGAK